jgi:enoyl-CoA hydratase/carnithine racemase
MDAVRFEDRDGARWITIERPPVNVFDIPTIEALEAALAPLADRLELKAVVLRSAIPRTFSAGVDVRDHTRDRVGLISRVVDDLEAETRRVVRLLSGKSAAVLKLARRALREGAQGHFDDALARVERRYREDLLATEDMDEGVQAFLEKRPPKWKDR